jgi:hypothetical protein
MRGATNRWSTGDMSYGFFPAEVLSAGDVFGVEK